MQEKSVIGLIDPPGRYAPKTQWQEFLARMQRLPQDDPQVQAALEQARQALSLSQGISPPASV
jgi:hypothetical protein